MYISVYIYMVRGVEDCDCDWLVYYTMDLLMSGVFIQLCHLCWLCMVASLVNKVKSVNICMVIGQPSLKYWCTLFQYDWWYLQVAFFKSKDLSSPACFFNAPKIIFLLIVSGLQIWKCNVFITALLFHAFKLQPYIWNPQFKFFPTFLPIWTRGMHVPILIYVVTYTDLHKPFNMPQFLPTYEVTYVHTPFCKNNLVDPWRRGLVVTSPPAEFWVVRSNPTGEKGGNFEVKHNLGSGVNLTILTKLFVFFNNVPTYVHTHTHMYLLYLHMYTHCSIAALFSHVTWSQGKLFDCWMASWKDEGIMDCWKLLCVRMTS
jgi:hypothetical protein